MLTTFHLQAEEECVVIQEIMRHCQRAVEQQLVTKGNDIRRVRTCVLDHHPYH